jgi:hypothetical protein
MGQRTLKRVPLDFDWPFHKVWKGYVDPHYRECPDCENGSTLAGEALKRLVHLLLIAGECGLQPEEDVHPWLREAGIERVSKDMTALSAGLAGRAPLHRFGHDACDVWTAFRKIVAAGGLPKRWGVCKTCRGSGMDPKVKRTCSRWRPTEPPAGDGWQLWETTSDGSPVSPVFATADELASWCAECCALSGGIFASKEQWSRMFTTPDGCDVGSTLVSFNPGRG